MTWKDIVDPMLASEAMVACRAFVKQRREETEVFPEGKETFAWFEWIKPEDIKLVICNFKPELGFNDINRSIKDALYSYLADEEFNAVKVTEPKDWAKHGILYIPASLTWEKDCNHFNYWKNLLYDVCTALKAPAYLFMGVNDDLASFEHSVVVSSSEMYNPKAILNLITTVKMYSRIVDNAHQFDVDYSDCIDFKKVIMKYVAALKTELIPDEVLQGATKDVETFKKAIQQWLPVHKTINFLK